MTQHVHSAPKYKCPLCSSQLTKQRWLDVTGVWKEQAKIIAAGKQREKAAEERGKKHERRRINYLQTLLKKRDDDYDKLNRQNKDLKRQLKRGTTPQMEGLLFEPELCEQLEKRFPKDKIEHHGKGGDILQLVMVNGKCVGRLVLECKRCSSMPSKHIEQTRRAMLQRKANYAVLVTNASKKNTFGFWTEKDVMLVHPAGALALVSWLREALIKLAESKMTHNQREQAAAAILDYVKSVDFRNPLRDIIRRSEELGTDLVKEIRVHNDQWLTRYGHYVAIWMDGHGLNRDVDSIVQKFSLGAPRERLTGSEKAKASYPISKETLLLPKHRAASAGA